MNETPRAMRLPWSATAARNFVTALLASPGFAVLVPTEGAQSRLVDEARSTLGDSIV
jgi:hypothetical protein